MAVVVDASAMVEVLLRGARGEAVRGHMRAAKARYAPAHAPLEAASAFARFERAGDLDPARATLAVRDLAGFPVSLVAPARLLPRAWELLHNVTVYDAAYLALAEALRATLVTADARLRRAAEHAGAACDVVVV